MKVREVWRRRMQLGVAVLMFVGTFMNFYGYFSLTIPICPNCLLLSAFLLVEPYSSSNPGILSKQDKILYLYSLSAEALKIKPPSKFKADEMSMTSIM